MPGLLGKTARAGQVTNAVRPIGWVARFSWFWASAIGGHGSYSVSPFFGPVGSGSSSERTPDSRGEDLESGTNLGEKS